MKKLLILLSLSFSLAASAQADQTFTAKMINAVNTAEAYYYNQTPANLQAASNAVAAFYPISATQFNSKLSAMLSSPVEMARFTGPISFIQCLASAAGQFNSCVNAANPIPYDPNHETQHIPADPPVVPPACTNAYQSAIIQCAINHLTR